MPMHTSMENTQQKWKSAITEQYVFHGEHSSVDQMSSMSHTYSASASYAQVLDRATHITVANN